MSGRMYDPRLAISQLDNLFRLEGGQALGQADAEPRGTGRRLRRSRVHAVADQEPHEALGAPRRIPNVAGVLDLPLEHPNRRPAPLLEPAGKPDMVRVKMGYHYSLHVVVQAQSHLCRPRLPGLTGRRVIEAGIYDCPPIRAFDQVRRDELERKLNWKLELVDAFKNSGDLPDGLRAQGRRRDAHTHRAAGREVSPSLSIGPQIGQHRALAYLAALSVRLLPVLVLDPLRKQPVHESTDDRRCLTRVPL